MCFVFQFIIALFVVVVVTYWPQDAATSGHRAFDEDDLFRTPHPHFQLFSNKNPSISVARRAL